MTKMGKVKHIARVEIYGLLDPNTGEVRYIGKANDSEKRLKSHLRDANRRDYPVYRWIKKLATMNLIPDLKVLLITDSDNWRQEEARLISEYRASGFKLLNIAAGGDEPFCSRETRVKNGIKNTSNLTSKLSRKKKSLADSLRVVLKYGGIEMAESIADKIEKRDKKWLLKDVIHKFRLRIEDERQKQIRRQA